MKKSEEIENRECREQEIDLTGIFLHFPFLCWFYFAQSRRLNGENFRPIFLSGLVKCEEERTFDVDGMRIFARRNYFAMSAFDACNCIKRFREKAIEAFQMKKDENAKLKFFRERRNRKIDLSPGANFSSSASKIHSSLSIAVISFTFLP